MENLFLSCIESRVENNRSIYGRFQLGPFNIGESVTIANAMRRTLLSELSGLAIIAVEIKGVTHEYSTIKGVRESVLDILLNLKQVVLSSDKKYNQPEIGFLKVQGPGVVKTSDLKLPSFIQCVDPDQYITTLSDNGILEMKFMICEGKNFFIETPFPLIKKSFQSNFQTKNLGKKNNSENNVKKSVNKTTQKKTSSIANSNFSRLTSKIQLSETNLLVTTRNFQEFEKILLNQNNKLNDTALINSLVDDSIKEIEMLYSSNLPFVNFGTISDKKPSNLLMIDATFMPISKVNFLIENVNEFSSISKISNISLTNRLKKTVLQEKIILEIWTNGSIHPRHAIHKAAQKLIDMFVPFQKTYFYKKTKFPVNSCFTILPNKTKVRENSLPQLKGLVKLHHKGEIEKIISPLDEHKLLFKDNESTLSPSINKIYRPWRAQLKKNEFKKISEKHVSSIDRCFATPFGNQITRKFTSLQRFQTKTKLKREFQKTTSNFSYKPQLSDIASLNLPFKSYICLKRANINTIDDILNCSRDELTSLKNFGEKSLKKLENVLLDRNCKLKENSRPKTHSV